MVSERKFPQFWWSVEEKNVIALVVIAFLAVMVCSKNIHQCWWSVERKIISDGGQWKEQSIIGISDQWKNNHRHW